MHSPVSNCKCKGGLNCVFGKLHHPFCCMQPVVLGPNWYQIENTICYIPKVCKFHIVKDIHVNTLESVIFDTPVGIVFYRAEHNVVGEPHAIEFWSS